MKKFINKKIVVTTLALVTVFGAGTFVGASSDWKGNAIGKAQSELLDAGNVKRQELLQDIDTKIQERVEENLVKDIAEGEDVVLAGIEAYFNDKLNNIANTPDYQEVQTEIDKIAIWVIEQQMYHIDKAFEGK